MSLVPRDLRGHRLRDVLAVLAQGDAEGELGCTDGAGRLHRLLLRGGRLVAVHVEGRFDPLLARLRRSGALDEASHRRALEALASSERRAGELARREGADARAIDEAVDAQQVAALEALCRRVDGTAARLSFAPRVVTAREVVSWGRAAGVRPKPARTRSVGTPTTERERSPATVRECLPAAELAMDRATFRRLVRELHPDRNGHLPPEERARRASRLAELTAAASRRLA